MSDLADKIRELKATKQFSDVDLHQMAEVMSYAKPEENYQRLKVLLLAGQPLVSREAVLGLVERGIAEAVLVEAKWWHNVSHECGLFPEREDCARVAAAERQMKRGSGTGG